MPPVARTGTGQPRMADPASASPPGSGPSESGRDIGAADGNRPAVVPLRRPADVGYSLSIGFTARTTQAAAERSGGLCERCGHARATQHHHRRPRGMGGSRRDSTNDLANLLHICHPCHDLIESRRLWAKLSGWLLEQNQDPESVPVVYRGTAMLLRNDGDIEPVMVDA